MVILVNEVKHACAACIRGHRVKSCQHTDRPMVPLVKRGRQVSQCTHCRDLRQTNKSHVKCTCAIASSPNPINGCLCELLLTCTCVATHLQDVKDDISSAYSSSPATSSCCSSSPQIPETVTAPSIAPNQNANIFDNVLVSDDFYSELKNFMDSDFYSIRFDEE